MCRAVRCKKCGGTTWSGCGQHVAQVKAGVPADQWCPGHLKDTSNGGGSSWWSRLTGRG
ncbi:MAG: hypothetical protein CMJ44_15305 [Pimelobacter sp.]|nr:hypothetical protein [Pimelobacter sp.]